MRYQSFYPFARQSTTSAPPFRPPANPYWGAMPPTSMGAGHQQRLNMPPGHLGGGMAQSPSRLDSYMNTAQQFLSTAQQFAPVIQQFAPMVQNLPAMWKLYKGLQSLPNADAAASRPSATRLASDATTSTLTERNSVPRIFQPPNGI